MRMWMVDPVLMCRRHLLGEHVECHMIRGSVRRGRTLTGFVQTGLVDSRQLVRRHDELATEMLRRGYRHESLLIADFDDTSAPGDVDVSASLRELAARCKECDALQSGR
jgi:Pyrimidine dimer DNA glycosylase